MKYTKRIGEISTTYEADTPEQIVALQNAVIKNNYILENPGADLETVKEKLHKVSRPPVYEERRS